MNLVRNLFFLFSVTLFALVACILFVYNYSPYGADQTVFFSFYLSLFGSLAGLLAIILLYIKVKMTKTQTTNTLFWPTLRQTSLFSLAVTLLLLLRGMRILDWLIGTSVVIVTVLLELFFQTKKEKVK
jgi:hypothetical protein